MIKQTGTLGEYLNQLRLARKLTFADLAKACDMATPTIWKVIKDKARPKDLTLQSLSEVLETSLTDMFRMRDKTRYPSIKVRGVKPTRETMGEAENKEIDKHALIELIKESSLSNSTIESIYLLIESIR